MGGSAEGPTALLVSLGRRFGLSPADGTARVDLRVDRRHRVTVRVGVGDTLLLEAPLCRLPGPAADKEAALDRLMLRVTAHASERGSELALDSSGERVMLQACVAREDADDLDERLEAFLNDLDYWTRAVDPKQR